MSRMVLQKLNSRRFSLLLIKQTQCVANSKKHNKHTLQTDHHSSKLSILDSAETITNNKRLFHSESKLDGNLRQYHLNELNNNVSSNFVLPKLPLPHIHSTLFKYLECLKPILNESEFKQTQSHVNEYLNRGKVNNAYYHQNILKKYALVKDNWAYDWYVDDYYYKLRVPLPIYSNPAKVMFRQHYNNEDSYLKFASAFIKGVLSFKFKVDYDTLEVDRCNAYEKGQPMCMNQYKKIFSSYRAPGVDQDTFTVYNNDLTNQHIIVISRNKFYKLDLLTDSKVITDWDLFYQLKQIRDDSMNSSNEDLDVGLLTSLPRSKWAVVRSEMLNDEVNQESLDLIERSAFVICLDKKCVDQSNSYLNEDVRVGMQILNGCGTHLNSANRFFDKTLQFILSEDGICGLVREHSPSEGPITVNLIQHVYDYIEQARYIQEVDNYPISKPRKLKWTKSDHLVNEISKARDHFDQIIENYDLRTFKYQQYGRKFPKSLNMSPDSFIQCAIQLAFYKMYGKMYSHGSVGSMRRFQNGRIDYIRSTNMDMLNWCKSMMPDSDTKSNEKLYLFKKAVDKQTNLMIDTILGGGIDCHLNALKNLAMMDEDRLDMPSLFKDDAFTVQFNNIKALTSQVTTSYDGTFSCFGSTFEDGYTLTYNYKADEILFTISSYKSCKENSNRALEAALTASLNELFVLSLQSKELDL